MAVDIRNPSSPPSIPAGDGLMWVWNATRGQWVRVPVPNVPPRSDTPDVFLPTQPSPPGQKIGGGGSSGQIDIFNPNVKPNVPTGVPGTAWAWNGQQWVRSYSEYQKETGGSTRPPKPDSGPSKWREPVLQEPEKPERERMPEQSARAIIRMVLEPLGLGELEDMLYGILLEDQDYSQQRLMVEIRRTPQYARRFPGMAARQAAGLPAISEGTYLDYETKYKRYMRNAGLPTGFYDSPDDFAKFIGGGVEPEELGRRIQNGYQAVAQADPSVLSTMRQFYGVTDGELAAYFLDPNRAESVILQQVATAQIGAAAAREGFGQAADRAAAERMQRLGVTATEATQAFGTLARGRELLTPIERGETALDVTETALGLTGRGGAEAAQRFATQQRRRVARFEGGGRFATQGQEVTGLRTT